MDDLQDPLCRLVPALQLKGMPCNGAIFGCANNQLQLDPHATMPRCLTVSSYRRRDVNHQLLVGTDGVGSICPPFWLVILHPPAAWKHIDELDKQDEIVGAHYQHAGMRLGAGHSDLGCFISQL